MDIAQFCGTSEVEEFERAIVDLYPEGAGRSAPARDRLPPIAYSVDFVALCLAEASRENETAGSSAASFERCFRRLLAEVKDPVTPYLACAVVEGLSVATPTVVAGVSIQPVPEGGQVAQSILEHLPLAATTVPIDEIPRPLMDPVCLFLGSVPGQGGLSAASTGKRDACELVDRVLLAVRLQKAATARDTFWIVGPQHVMGGDGPTYLPNQSGSLLRRATSLAPEDVPGLEALIHQMERVRRPAEKLVIDPIVVAVNKFTFSHQAKDWWTHLVDLMTGLEAALSGTANESVGLRIRSRAAVLLAAGDDEPDQIFSDLKTLYDLRSTLVHGGALTERALGTRVRKVISEPDFGEINGFTLDRLVDRLRDLLRRAILARVALGSPELELWTNNDDAAVDLMLVSAEQHGLWREAWHKHWLDRGLRDIWQPASPAITFLEANSRT